MGDGPRRTARVYEVGIREARCKSCGAPIVFTRIVSSGKWMPFDAPLEILGEGAHLPITDITGLNAGTLLIPLDRSHFGTCPHAKRWSKPR